MVFADIGNIVAVCPFFQNPSNCLALICRQMDVVLYIVLFCFFETGEFFKNPFHNCIIPLNTLVKQRDLLMLEPFYLIELMSSKDMAVYSLTQSKQLL